ncbi:MAG: DEAD/DEAH box helicase, partial [Bacilli bacterium]|nr:DEAD/DEAH box helicase [Bacilli bacterium]
MAKRLDWPLYRHQIEAIERVEKGHSIVVTTGTGSGKTECFLYPILDQIIKDIKANGPRPGIRAILLYPMNALINDQAHRIRETLSCYPNIRFGFYNSGTPEDEKDKREERKLIKDTDENGKEIDFPPNEALYRRDIRQDPPHILFTNFSMLERMLVTPNDAMFLSGDKMKYWQYMVLDEAHIYHGAQGVEIAMLLRRLCGWAKRKPQFILTSATLGRGKDDVDQIISFAEQLTSASYTRDDILFSERQEIVTSSFDLKVKEADYHKMAGEIEANQSVFDVVKNYLPHSNPDAENKILLADLLKRDQNAYFLYLATKGRQRPFHEISEELYAKHQISETALIDLVGLIAKAADSFDHPVLNVKYHTFMRAPDGAYITLNPQPSLQLMKAKEIGNLHAFSMAICSRCGTPYIFGKVVDDILEIGADIEETDETIDVQDYYEYFALADFMNPAEVDRILLDAAAEQAKLPKATADDFPHECLICSKCGHVYDPSNAGSCGCSCGSQYENRVIKVPSKTKPEYCAMCNNRGQEIIDLHIGKDRAASILSQIILRSMEGTDLEVSKEEEEFDPFAFGTPKPRKKKEAKQMICFSDSRQNAAYFATLFNEIEGHFVKKAMLWDLLEKAKKKAGAPKALTIDELVGSLTSIYRNDFGAVTPPAKDEAWIAILYELLRTEGNHSAENLGMYAFQIDFESINRGAACRYDDPNLPKLLAAKGFPGLSNQQFMDLTAEIVDRFRTAPAINYPELDKSTRLRDYIGYRSIECAIKVDGSPDDDARFIHSLLPRKSAKSSRQPKENKLLNYVKRAFGLTDRFASETLIRLAFRFACAAGLIVPKPGSEDRVYKDAFAISAGSFILQPKEKLHFYHCPKCHTITTRSINGVCPTHDCPGHLEEIADLDAFFGKNYYRRVYLSKTIEKITAEEHTAQWSKEKAHQIQEDFKAKKLNVLSCSTTFEMGIDIGSLDT